MRPSGMSTHSSKMAEMSKEDLIGPNEDGPDLGFHPLSKLCVVRRNLRRKF